MRKKADFQYLTLKPFSKSSLTFEVGQRFSLTFEPDSLIKEECRPNVLT